MIINMTDTFQIIWGATDVEISNELAGSSIQPIERWIQKKFVDILYNQLEVNPYACTIVATATAISNLTWKVIPYSLMKDVWNKGVSEWWLKENYGGALNDAVHHMVEAYNTHFKDCIRTNFIVLTESSLYDALKHSPVISGINYPYWYIKDEQDDGKLKNGYTKGANGHAITFVKINTLDDVLVKFAENYAGALPYNVIFSDFTKNRDLFFKGGYYLTRD